MKNKLTVGPNNARRVIGAHFRIAGRFVVVISNVRPKLERLHQLLAKENEINSWWAQTT